MRWVPVLLLVAACSGSDDEGTAPIGEPSGCDPLVPDVCALPWPSGLFEVEDASMPNGLRVEIGPETMPENRDFVQIRPDMFHGKDGFSTLGPMVAWFGDVDLEGTIGHDDIGAYADPAAKTAIVDTVTGERMPHFVELDMSAEEGERVLFIRPARPLEHGRRYVVGIRGLELASGGPVPVSDAFVALRDGTTTRDADVESRRQRFEDDVFPALEGAGLPRSELQLAWEFTTVSRENSLGKMLAMRDDTLERIGPTGPPYVVDSVEDEDCAVEGTTIGRTVYGHFTSPRYTDVDAPGALLSLDEDGMPVYTGDTDVDFMVRIPCSVFDDPSSPGQVLQYGHGLLGDFSEARTGYLSALANDHRYIIFAQNWTGMSQWDAAWITLMLTLDPSDFHAIPERTQQGFTEWVAGARLVKGALADDDAMKVQGSPVVDATKPVVYYGNSQGAILGGAYFALSPDIERAVLGVGGMPYALLLSRSADFDPFFLVFKEKFPDGRDIALMLAAFQTAWDPGESAGYASALLDPLPGTPPKQVLLQVGIGDAQVTTLGAHVAARAWGAKSVAPAVRPIWGVDEASAPFQGSAIVEWHYLDGATEPYINEPPDDTMDTHECPRREPAAQQQLVDFLTTGTVSQYCDGTCEGVREGFCD